MGVLFSCYFSTFKLDRSLTNRQTGHMRRETDQYASTSILSYFIEMWVCLYNMFFSGFPVKNRLPLMVLTLNPINWSLPHWRQKLLISCKVKVYDWFFVGLFYWPIQMEQVSVKRNVLSVKTYHRYYRKPFVLQRKQYIFSNLCLIFLLCICLLHFIHD